MPKLIITRGSQVTTFSVKNIITTIGRTDDNNLPLKDIKVSRAHCQIIKIVSGYKIVDLNSGNGTRVNNEKIKEHVLRDKDLIKVGDVQMIFDAAGNSSESHAPVSAVAEKAPDFGEQPEMDYQSTVIVHAVTSVKAVSSVSPAAKVAPPNNGVKKNNTAPLVARPSVPPAKPKPSIVSAKKTAGTGFSKLSGIKKHGKTLSSGKTRARQTDRDDDSGENGSAFSKPKKSNTMLIGVISGAVLVVIIGAVLMMGGGGSKDKGKEESAGKSETKELYAKIQEASQKGNYSDGLEFCDKFLEKYKTSKLAVKVKETQEDLQKRLAREAEAQSLWGPLKAKSTAAGSDEAAGIVAELKAFMEKYNGTRAAALAIGELESQQKLVEMNNSPARKFNELNARIYRELISQKKYDEAIKEFEDFMKQNPNDSIICEQVKQEINKIKGDKSRNK
jgi:tetratricopeptide (TPR) repeat protein